MATITHGRLSDIVIQEGQKDHTAQRFVGVVESIDERLKKSTVGLVTLSDFQKTKEGLEEEQRQVAAQTAKRWAVGARDTDVPEARRLIDSVPAPPKPRRSRRRRRPSCRSRMTRTARTTQILVEASGPGRLAQVSPYGNLDVRYR